jgi:hypothetical protein
MASALKLPITGKSVASVMTIGNSGNPTHLIPLAFLFAWGDTASQM